MVGKEIKVEAYSGYKAGETPRRIYLQGKEYPVVNIIYRYQKYDIDTEDYADVFKLSLKDYGDCEVFYKHRLDQWEMEDVEEPEKSFADAMMEENK